MILQCILDNSKSYCFRSEFVLQLIMAVEHGIELSTTLSSHFPVVKMNQSMLICVKLGTRMDPH